MDLLSRIIDFSLRHRPWVIAGAAALAAAGGLAVRRLPFDAFPDVSEVQVQVNTAAPRLSPVEVERQITFPVERALSGVAGVRSVRSLSRSGLSQVTVVFEDAVPVHRARAQVLERVSTAELPDGMERPSLGPVATGLGEIFHYIVTSPDGDLTAARTAHDWIIRPQLLAVPGVAEVNAWGGFERQFHVVVRPERLAARRLGLCEVVEALREANRDADGGGLAAGGERHLLRAISRPGSAEEIGRVVVARPDGSPVRVADVADVVEGGGIRHGAVTAEGRGEAVLGLAFLLMGENSREVSRDLSARMEAVRKSLPEGTRVEVVYDRRALVDHVLGTVRANLFEGALLVVVILYLFLGRLRPALIVALAIPLSMLFAAGGMARAGIAGSLMSLGAIDFGLIVDSSVVLIENAVRRVGGAPAGADRRAIVREAAVEVRRPTLFGELIILIVYLPILTLEGIEGKLFRPMVLTVVFALTGSMLLSLTLMPVLASLGLGRQASAPREPLAFRWAKRLYGPVLGWSLRRRREVLVLAVAILSGGAFLATRLGAVFVPRLDEGSIVINTVRLAGVSLDESVRYGAGIERLLKEAFPDEIESVWTRTGTAEVATDPMGIEVSDVFVMLRERGRWTKARTKDELVARMDRLVASLPGMRYAFTQPIEMRMNEMVAGVRSDVGVKLYGPDFGVLTDRAAAIEAVLRGIPGAEAPAAEQVTGQPVIEARLDPERLSRHDLSPGEALEAVEAVVGHEAGEVLANGRRFPLVVRLPDGYRDDPDRIGSLPVAAAGGNPVLLSQVAEIVRTTGPTAVTREWGERRIVVQTNVRGDLAGFVAEAQRRIEAEVLPTLPPGYRIEWGGQYEHLIRASRRLAIVVPTALALVFALLYATYGDWIDTLRVFTGIPFAAVGGILALWIRDMPFSISAGVGFVALCGVAVLDDMILVSRVRQLLARGMALEAALEEAAMTRLRPVLMTGLVASLGFLPMAFSTGIGAEVQRPLATVVIGGVASSTVMSLLVLRVLYLFWGGFRGGTGADARAEAGKTV